MHSIIIRPMFSADLDFAAACTAAEEQEVRWHVAQMLPRLRCRPREQGAAVAILRGYLADRSAIVRTMAMQALADFAARDPALRAEIVPLLEGLTRTGTPAMRSRGCRLLRRPKP